jgi:hypothetical protein
MTLCGFRTCICRGQMLRSRLEAKEEKGAFMMPQQESTPSVAGEVQGSTKSLRAARSVNARQRFRWPQSR